MNYPTRNSNSSGAAYPCTSSTAAPKNNHNVDLKLNLRNCVEKFECNYLDDGPENYKELCKEFNNMQEIFYDEQQAREYTGSQIPVLRQEKSYVIFNNDCIEKKHEEFYQLYLKLMNTARVEKNTRVSSQMRRNDGYVNRFQGADGEWRVRRK